MSSGSQGNLLTPVMAVRYAINEMHDEGDTDVADEPINAYKSRFIL